LIASGVVVGVLNPPNLQGILAALPGLQILEVIRGGGQKSVWRASFQENVYALKIMRPEPTAIERAKREIRIMQECRCPYLVSLGPCDLQEIKINERETLIFYLEEFIDGDPLDTFEKPMVMGECRDLALQISEAIASLWNRGYVHRDIKPGNIMRRADGRNFVLLDIGLALMPDESTITNPGAIVGTQMYLSPDQIRLVNSKRDLDFRSDLHALGLVLYECITGVHPLWNERTPQANLVGNILAFRPLPLIQFRPETPTEFQEIVLRLLEKEPNMRYRKIEYLREALEALVIP
jgi:serine/threonine protein kinase